jgi:mRNA-degrading endonuclease toxin of MazEF toxin-antitoxin module
MPSPLVSTLLQHSLADLVAGITAENLHGEVDFGFEVPIVGKPPRVVLSDQVKSLDWRARQATRKGKVKPAELAAIRNNAKVLIG